MNLRLRYCKPVGTAACLLAMLLTLGGHWMALQSFAWARMIGQYARQGSLANAVARTFDGRHPCELCILIQNGRQQEQAQNKNLPCTFPDRSSELLCSSSVILVPLPPQTATRAVPTVPDCHTDFIESPPTPPPRKA